MAIRPGLLSGALSAGALIALTACDRSSHLSASWTGADTGAAELPLSATSCVPDQLSLTAISGDTGVLILLRPPAGGSGAGQLPVLSPADFQQTRPAATITARWLDSTTVSGYRSARGTVSLSSTARPEGSFSAVLQRQGDQQEVTLEGEFRAAAMTACPDSAG
ncbi:MAG TPA: hypothetical protein VFS94_01415 [Gemmatimonadales bacterium]|nr:hypothetical protein [Gemmatimonadales bacterium]